MLAAELGSAAIQRHLVESRRALEEHVFGQMRETGMRAVEARAGAHTQRDRRQLAGMALVHHTQATMAESGQHCLRKRRAISAAAHR